MADSTASTSYSTRPSFPTSLTLTPDIMVNISLLHLLFDSQSYLLNHFTSCDSHHLNHLKYSQNIMKKESISLHYHLMIEERMLLLLEKTKQCNYSVVEMESESLLLLFDDIVFNVSIFDVKVELTRCIITFRHEKQLYSKKYGVHLARFTHMSSAVIYASTKEDGKLLLLQSHYGYLELDSLKLSIQ